jgi:DNA-directed RNA polymerase subunit N (RpoN/RPB10)
MFPVCCFTCGRRIEPKYEPFRKRVYEIQDLGRKDPETYPPEKQQDMVAGALSVLDIHAICCRIIFLSHVDTRMDELAARGEHLGDDLYAKTPGEINGTVRIIRTTHQRRFPSILNAR